LNDAPEMQQFMDKDILKQQMSFQA